MASQNCEIAVRELQSCVHADVKPGNLRGYDLIRSLGSSALEGGIILPGRTRSFPRPHSLPSLLSFPRPIVLDARSLVQWFPRSPIPRTYRRCQRVQGDRDDHGDGDR